jgi:hypothetical protein
VEKFCGVEQATDEKGPFLLGQNYQTIEIRGRKRKSYGEHCTRPRLSNSKKSVANSSRPKDATCVELQKHSDKRIRDNHRRGTGNNLHTTRMDI